MKDFLLLLTIGLVFLISWDNALAQEPLRKLKMEQELVQAKNLLASFKNDSAFLILDKLSKELLAINQLETPFGIDVQFCWGEALEKDHKNESALQKLLYVKEISQEKELWDIFTNACLVLANLYEKIGRKNDCLVNLKQAESTIDRYEIDSIYPKFAIRISSYYRIFSSKDSSIFYAKEVLRTAPKFKLFPEEAVGNLLMGLLLRDSSYEKSKNHFFAAGRTFLKIEDYSGYSAIYHNLSRLHFKNKKPLLALSHNDTTIAAGIRANAMGHEKNFALVRTYMLRGEIYKTLGQLDSSLFFLQKGYEMELDLINASNSDKVVEIDSRYKDEKKIQKIADQEKQIKFERERRLMLLGITLIVLLFTSILSYFYIRLRKANKRTKSQSFIIKKNNDDLSISLQQQIILQGEVHHRVKNNLQVIISLLELHKEDAVDEKVKQNMVGMANRIYSMAAIHDMLYQQENMAQVVLSDYTKNLCSHFSNFSLEENKPEFKIEIGNQYFNLETSMPLGIILTELLTNSLKYGRVKGKKLKINIGLEKLKDGYCLNYNDNGLGFPNDVLKERKGGLGTYLLESMTRQLNGHLESRNNDGAAYKIFFKEKNNPFLVN